MYLNMHAYNTLTLTLLQVLLSGGKCRPDEVKKSDHSMHSFSLTMCRFCTKKVVIIPNFLINVNFATTNALLTQASAFRYMIGYRLTLWVRPQQDADGNAWHTVLDCEVTTYEWGSPLLSQTRTWTYTPRALSIKVDNLV